MYLWRSKISAGLLLAMACGDSTSDGATTSTAGTVATTTTASQGSQGDPSSGVDPSTPTDGGSGTGDSGSSGDGPAPGFDLPALDELNTDELATSPICAECHANAEGATAMRDAKSRPIAPFDLWRATAMANSARDPFWWAMMSAEVAATPVAQAEIEATCLGCHAPMARVHNEFTGLPAPTRADLLGDSKAGKLGIDGVACALCHQIQPDGLGTDASYTGGFLVKPLRQIYGPHASPFTMPMQHRTGFTPTKAEHTTSAGLCGSCHTLQTETLDPDGTKLPGLFPEQATYLEWRNSDFRDEGTPGSQAAACGACHMPTSDADGAPISTRIARNPRGADFPPIAPRDPYGRHIFVGGNTLLPALLRDHSDALRPNADAAAFDAVIASVRAQLAERTATVGLTAKRSGDSLHIDVSVHNLAGHKFPSGYPSRRAWLRIRVSDGSDALRFRSGEVDGEGRLLDGAGQPLASELVGGPVQPHHPQIASEDVAQVYESVMADKGGLPAFRLLRARSFVKDNRLLPAGWDIDHPDAARTSPVGVGADADFVAAADTTRYIVAAPVVGGPYTISVELLYQPLAPRFAAELFAVETPEVRAFEALYEGAEHTAEHVAAAELVAP
ncbi:multiheme c-type cytochrome [Nannocystis sp.]|uniref:multiheme c-type cytochrome n=1 Tax=Nannocystis sp. TaxID=1962667 RepID=UPI0025FC2CA1|nr:multiheme c-type cytochrome [Nannocystis sp.]MBK7829836.1 hypothetical protein [Nannocystis sp.]